MSLLEIFSILFIHWIADFILQTDQQAKNKSTNSWALIDHTLTYTLVWAVVGMFYLMLNNWSLEGFSLYLRFLVITFVAHTITDYFTSRLNSKLWAKGDVHNFFVSIGFDQILHYVQLFLTYYWLR